MERAKVLFQLGDRTEQQYRAERDRLRRELAELHPVKQFDLERAAALLQKFGDPWSTANPKEQEEISHVLIERLYTFGGKIVGIEPKADFYALIAIAAPEAELDVSDKVLTPLAPQMNLRGHARTVVSLKTSKVLSCPPQKRVKRVMKCLKN